MAMCEGTDNVAEGFSNVIYTWGRNNGSQSQSLTRSLTRTPQPTMSGQQQGQCSRQWEVTSCQWFHSRACRDPSTARSARPSAHAGC